MGSLSDLMLIFWYKLVLEFVEYDEDDEDDDDDAFELGKFDVEDKGPNNCLEEDALLAVAPNKG